MRNKVRKEMEKILIGKEQVLTKVLAAMLAGGHVLIEDVPGVGKTTLALGIARLFDFSFKRVQFTPDVLPSDVTGFMIFDRRRNDFIYKEGAVMTNILLADEINRASAKTQAALLEVMEENQVTVDSVTRELPNPFLVLATQNPFGYAGTQRLPESQLDRFMIQVSIGYPSLEAEVQMYQEKQQKQSKRNPFNQADFLEMKQQVQQVEIKDCIYEYSAKIVQATRSYSDIELGVSPRGGLALLAMSKAWAFLNGRTFVIPEDIWDVFGVTVFHRIIWRRKGRTEDFLESLRKSISVPKGMGGRK